MMTIFSEVAILLYKYLCLTKAPLGNHQRKDVYPYDPAGGRKNLDEYCLVEEFLDDGYLQEYNSTGE
jgi:hypothetical protein